MLLLSLVHMNVNIVTGVVGVRASLYKLLISSWTSSVKTLIDDSDEGLVQQRQPRVRFSV